MLVGVNYPWFDYAWDFGAAPPGWRPATTPRWYGAITTELQFLATIGVSVVRWFILADGFAYGTGSAAPQPDTSPGHGGQWRFHPPTISPDLLAHFGELLDRFVAVNRGLARPRIQLMPVFIDFKFCEGGLYPIATNTDWVKQGRSDAINDATKRRQFLERALRPLLDQCASPPARRSMIYAWDIINEPEWVTAGWASGHRPVTEPAMRAFLDEAKTMIRSATFKPTIGFNKLETINRTRIFADINQFHHYTNGRDRLPRHTFSPNYPAILGEFATLTTSDRWPELGTNQRTLQRLRLAASQGYPLAMPWCYLHQTDTHGQWTMDVARDIECFTQGRNCPPP